MKDTALEKAFADYLKRLFDMVREEEPELFRTMKNMIVNGKADEVRDFIWEGIERGANERPLATIVAEGDTAAADDWARRAKAGEIMRIT
jgi:hypothetical protein